MFEFYRLSLITMETNEWFFFQVYVALIWLFMLPRMILAGVYYFKRRQQSKPKLYKKNHSTTVVLTIYKEDAEILEQCVKKVYKSLIKGCEKFSFIAIIDGWSPEQINSPQYKVVSTYADLVLGTDARNKRKNLRAMCKAAREHNILYETMIFLDSDTIPHDDEVVARLMVEFDDPQVGGVTTAQLIHEPRTLMQRISFWLENARLNSSMAAASLFGQVLCLPGRMYALRTHLVEQRMDELVNDSFSYFGFMRRNCVAGDDRTLTNFILQAGYKTLLVPEALVTTTAPADFKTTCKMWARWGRTSQGYTIRSPWLRHYPFAFFVAWSDIFISLLTVYLVAVHWPYQMIFGSSTIPLVQAVTFAVMGMLLTMTIRQAPHLYQYKRDWPLLPMFVMIATLGQFIRVWSLLTQHKVGVWGSRAGADSKEKNDTVLILKDNRLALSQYLAADLALKAQTEEIIRMAQAPMASPTTSEHSLAHTEKQVSTTQSQDLELVD